MTQVEQAPPAQPTASDAAELLRARGLRATGPRIAVLAAVVRAPHGDAEQVEAAVRADGADISRASVYNVLADLTAKGLLRRIEPAGSPARYETRTGDNHHHLVCRSCGFTADVDCAVGSRNCLEPSQTSGFVLDEAEVIFWGLCASCRPSDSPSPDPH